MSTPGYYKTDYRALKFSELRRWYGFRIGLRQYLVTRFMKAGGGLWMPSLWLDAACTLENFSEECLQAMKLHRAQFEKLGFRELGFRKITKHFYDTNRDSGSIFYITPDGVHVGALSFSRARSKSTGAELIRLIIGFSATFDDGRLVCTNNSLSFEPSDDDEVIRVKSHEVNFVYEEFKRRLQKKAKSPIGCPDDESYRQRFDARQIKHFEERVRRGLFVPMTENEIEAAKIRMELAASGIFPPARKKFRLEFWPVVLVLAFALLYFFDRHNRSPDNIMEYRGEKIKLSKSYATYEDYKDDPNNLDTNELDRIERIMTSAKIPLTYKDRKEWVYTGILNLEFPGYGSASYGGVANTDDGTVIELDSVEIPQRDKDRYAVVRKDHRKWTVVDDFIFSTATNIISNVKLEKRTLKYFDDKGNLLREKHLE